MIKIRKPNSLKHYAYFIKGDDSMHHDDDENILKNRYKDYFTSGFSNTEDRSIESMFLFSCINTKHQISDTPLNFIINSFNSYIKKFSFFLQKFC